MSNLSPKSSVNTVFSPSISPPHSSNIYDISVTFDVSKLSPKSSVNLSDLLPHKPNICDIFFVPDVSSISNPVILSLRLPLANV